jgi:RNA polymerase sigma-70 factor (ECF subfamily)
MSRRLSQIQTRWSLVFQAHETQADARTRAQGALMQRYHGAIYRYILAAVRDHNKADDIAGEFALRLVRGSFKNANPERGRFRDFIKTAVSNLITDMYRKKEPGPIPPGAEGAIEGGELPSDKEFTDRWRQELLDRAWDGLAQVEQEAGQPFYTLLRYRAENPDVRAAQMGVVLKEQLGKEMTELAVRKALQRARERFADLLLEEVARSLQSSLQDSTVEAIEQELIDLDLLAYCRSALERFGRKEGPAD